MCRTEQNGNIWALVALPVAARILDGLEQRFFGGGAAGAAVAGHVGVGDAEFSAAAVDFAPEFFERDRLRG